jgi:histidinol dehydrogenase
MIEIIKYPEQKTWSALSKRPALDKKGLEKRVGKVLNNVKKKGDKAIRKFTRKFDGVKLDSSAVREAEIEIASSLLSPTLKEAIQLAKKNIETFHLSQKREIKKIETMPGVVCWREEKAIEKVGLYIPGGSAPLFSTVLMLAIPASIAGCKEVVLCTPPDKSGNVNPAILYAANLCGVTKIFKVGGIQAIAAMAYGTETIPQVFKIFGPGNQYLTAAKQLIQKQGVAIDMPAGPSEVLVIADDSAIPAFVAADLLSQAEHGSDSQVVLISTSERLTQQVQECITQQLAELPRKAIAEKALRNSKIILASSLQDAFAFSNIYAPEHLIISCNDAEALAEGVITAGSVFIGHYSPESVGDYASGTNHTLPTNGYANAYSGVSLDSFIKQITFQQLSKEGLQNIGNTVMAMAEAEGLEAHKQAVAIRLKN